MSKSRHQKLHSELNDYLKGITDENGNHMRPQKGNSGEKIINTFSREKRLNAMKGFYDQHPYKYFDARWDFYKNNNMLKRWRPWGR